MSNVSSILTNLASQVSTTLGATYQELSYSYQLERNSFREAQKGYAVGVGDGGTVEGTNRNVTMDTDFFVVLTDTFTNRSDDANERAVISSLYDQMEEVHKDIFQKKLGIPSVVLVVSAIIMESPEVIDKGTLALRGSFTIKHRNSTE